MTRSPAAKSPRLAALGLSAVLSVGVLVPFIGVDSASAAQCTTVSSSYSTASSKLAHDKAKLHKAKKKLKKAKKHDKSHRVIKHKKKKVHKLRQKVRDDRANRNYWNNQKTTCTTGTGTGGGTTTPANPLNQLLTTLTGAGLSPEALTDLLTQMADQIRATGADVPGADQLASVLDQLASAIGSGASSIDPGQLQSILSQLPSSIDPAAFQQALADAAATLQGTLADPPTTPEGLVDTILSAVSDGLDTAGVPTLPGVVDQVQSVLDQILGTVTGGIGL